MFGEQRYHLFFCYMVGKVFDDTNKVVAGGLGTASLNGFGRLGFFVWLRD